MLVYKFFIDPIREHEAAVLIATIALAMFFQEVILLIFTGDYLSVAFLIQGFFTIGGDKIFYQQLLTFGVVLVILLPSLVPLNENPVGPGHPFHGRGPGSGQSDGNEREPAGHDHPGPISVGLAGITGAVIVPLTVLTPFMWMEPLIMMMAVVVLGGLGSIKGSFIAAYILGFAEALVVFLVPTGAFLKGPVALSIMILVLLIRPEGLFGIAFEEER